MKVSDQARRARRSGGGVSAANSRRGDNDQFVGGQCRPQPGEREVCVAPISLSVGRRFEHNAGGSDGEMEWWEGAVSSLTRAGRDMGTEYRRRPAGGHWRSRRAVDTQSQRCAKRALQRRVGRVLTC